MDYARFIMIFVSILIVLVASAYYWKVKHQPIKTIWFAVSIGVLFPFLSMGYNVLACSSAKRVAVFDKYPYSCRGIIKVEGQNGLGLRDRYGYIMPTQYDSIVYLGQNTPYCKVMEDSLWGIYDMESQSLEAQCRYLSIKQYKDERRVWQLESEYNGETYFNYFKPYRFYGRFYPYNNTEISHEPMRHALEDFEVSYMPDKVECPKILDRFFADMMNSLWTQDENVPMVEHRWKWTKRLSAKIDSLYEKEGMFQSDTLDRYEAAIQQIETYIDGGLCQMEMNNSAYVFATCHSYLMHRKNIELAVELPYVDFFKEYRLFNEYQTYSAEFWNKTHNVIYGHYSDRPREAYMESLYRFDKRKKYINDFLSVVRNDKIIKARGARPSDAIIKKAFHEQMPKEIRPIGMEFEYATDTICTYFLKWIAFRDSVASQLPLRLADSYRNQTVNILIGEGLLGQEINYNY